MLNIGGDSRDASYRYKMPPLTTKIEGRGNGIKTVLVNMTEVAKHLHIHPAYPTKYFGIELGAQSKFDPKVDRAIVNGAHSSGDLAKLLEKFIQAFILCPKCKLPELSYKVGRDIKISCAACGHASVVNTPHKLAGYILKNPPNSFAGDKDDKKKTNSESSAAPAALEATADQKAVEAEDDAEEVVEVKKKKKDKDGDKKDKKEKKEKKDKKKKTKEEGSSSEEDPDVEVPAARKTKSKKTADEEDDEWHTDTSKEAQQARKEAELAEMKASVVNAEAAASIEAIEAAAKADNKVESPVTTLKIFLAQTQRSPHEIVGQLKLLQLSRTLDEPNKWKVLLEALIDTSAISSAKLLCGAFVKNAATLKLLSKDKISASVFLNVIEDYVGATNPKFISYIPQVLQTLYENEVLEEESIISWYDSPPEASYLVNKDVAFNVRQKAQPFINWLKTAEEEDED